MELLLSAGALVNQRSYAGYTPFYCALYRPNKEVQALLRANGATYTQDNEEEEEYRESEEVRANPHTLTNRMLNGWLQYLLFLCLSQDEFDDVIINGQRVL